jgi:hypothetical protein
VSVAAAVVAGALVLGLGALASAALFAPGELSIPTRTASVPALGCAAASLSGALLVIAHALTVATMLAALVVLTVALGVRARRARTAPGLAAAVRRAHLGLDTLPVVLGLAVLAAIAVSRLGIPVAPIAGGWRYWADGLEFASVGHVPDATLQWGALYPPAVSKLAANAFVAELSFGFSRHPLAGMAVLLWLSAVGYAAGLWALAWELGLRWTAPLVPILALAGGHTVLGITPGADVALKLESFQDEDLGRALAVVGAALAIRAARDEGATKTAAVAVLVLTAAALTHLIPVMVVAALLVAYAGAHAAAHRRPRRAATPLAIVAAALVLTLAMLAAAGGEIGFGGSSASSGYPPYRGRYDPTLAFEGRLERPHAKSQDRWYEPPAATAHAYLRVALGERAGGWRLAVVALLLVLIGAAAAAAGETDIRMLVATALGMGALLLAAGLWFTFSSAYYIPATFGPRRLFEYGALPLMLLLLALVEAAVPYLGRVDSRAPAVVAAALVLAALAGTGSLRPNLRALGPTADYVNAARLATPCDARLLPDISTRGAFQALTGRTSLLEGLAPYLRPAILARVLDHTAAARRFLHDPVHNVGFLATDHVDDVLVHRGKGGRRWRAFDDVAQLTRVRQIGGVRVYHYDGPGAGGGARPNAAAGYTCQEGALA